MFNPFNGGGISGGSGGGGGGGLDPTQYYNRTQVDNKLNTKITSPDTATVGQVLVVKSIDSNGHPLTWECITKDGVTNYENLSNLPEINGVKLVGNKTLSNLGIASEDDVKKRITAPTTIAQVGQLLAVESLDENGKPKTWKVITQLDDVTISESSGDDNKGTFTYSKGSSTDNIKINGLKKAAYLGAAAELTTSNWLSENDVPTVKAVTTEIDKKLNSDKMASKTENGVMSSYDKNKLDNIGTFNDDASMKLAIDGMFSGYDMSGLDPDDDDGIANQSDVEEIFTENTEPEEMSREAQSQGTFESLSADEIDSISLNDETPNSDNGSIEEPDDGDLDNEEIDNILGI